MSNIWDILQVVESVQSQPGIVGGAEKRLAVFSKNWDLLESNNTCILRVLESLWFGVSSPASQVDGSNGDPPQDNPLGGGVSKEQNLERNWEAASQAKESKESGVPRGSVLGPLLFPIFINNLADKLTCNHLFFADNVKIVVSKRKEHGLSSSVQQAIKWSRRWNLPLNTSKSHYQSRDIYIY